MTFALRHVFALALTLAAPAALAQEGERPGGLFDIIFGGSERLTGERTVAQPAVERTAQANSPDLVLRLERLENQIRQLTGFIEQLQYRNQQLENQVRRMQEESEAKGTARPAATMRPQTAPITPPAIAPPLRRGDAFDPAANPNAP